MEVWEYKDGKHNNPHKSKRTHYMWKEILKNPTQTHMQILDTSTQELKNLHAQTGKYTENIWLYSICVSHWNHNPCWCALGILNFNAFGIIQAQWASLRSLCCLCVCTVCVYVPHAVQYICKSRHFAACAWFNTDVYTMYYVLLHTHIHTHKHLWIMHMCSLACSL